MVESTVSKVNSPLAKKRIKAVVADGTASSLEFLLSLLESAGQVDVISAGMSGGEAICAVADFDPDLVLMDIDMAPMSGVAAAMVISALYPRTKVMLMSAKDCEQARAECLSCGVHSFVSKENFMREFPDAIRQLGLDSL